MRDSTARASLEWAALLAIVMMVWVFVPVSG